MGASQSSHKAGAAGGTDANAEPAFVDYYELLHVEQSATSDEIRKAYRKLALKHHPDKNPDNVEQANKIFHKLQEAYEILSDDTERAWYDQNRERLLNGDGPDLDDEEVFEAFRSGAAEAPQPTRSSRGLTAKALLRFFDPSLAKDLSDGDNGFFSTYRRLFERLAQEERIAAPYPGEEKDVHIASADAYPSFGYSHTPYTHARGDEAAVHQTPAKDFYSVFMNFQSRKSFGWFDKYDLRDAPDRRVKRLMEKENKRARDAARREYNDAVRSLAAFVRKRDPRYKKFQAELNSTGPGSAADVARRKAEAERIRLEREARAQSYQAQSWQQPDYRFSDEEDEESEDDDDQDGSDAASDDDATNQGDASGEAIDDLGDPSLSGGWDCVACDKFFQSEAAFRNHERSAKHKKAVQKLQREMQDEEDELGLGLDADDIAIDASLADLHLNGTEKVSAGFSIPSFASEASGGKSKKQKKQAKKKRQMEEAAGLVLDEDGFVVQDLNRKPRPKKEAAPADLSADTTDKARTDETLTSVHVVDEELAGGSDRAVHADDRVGAGDEESAPAKPSAKADAHASSSIPNGTASTVKAKKTDAAHDDDPWGGLEDPYIPESAFSSTIPPPLPAGSRPPGSFDIFGYGSLIFKPPPYVIGATPCYIKGFVRRFAQHSVDHRGTRSRPGRVVTLVKASDWHPLRRAAKVDEPKSAEGDIVWGVSFTIDPEHAPVVRQYLDYREKNGYSAMHVPLYTRDSDDAEKEIVVLKNALVYVGLPSNPAFVGPQSLDALAQRIYTCAGPSGPNPEYLLNLAKAVRELAPQSVDQHLFSLEKRLLLLQEQNIDPKVLIAQESRAAKDATSKPTASGAVSTDEDEAPEGGKKGKGKAKQTGKSKEWCNVCSAGFESRSKLFNHIRETGHALAADQPGAGGKKGRRR